MTAHGLRFNVERSNEEGTHTKERAGEKDLLQLPGLSSRQVDDGAAL
jgi:hypothetical protein